MDDLLTRRLNEAIPATDDQAVLDAAVAVAACAQRLQAAPDETARVLLALGLDRHHVVAGVVARRGLSDVG